MMTSRFKGTLTRIARRGGIMLSAATLSATGAASSAAATPIDDRSCAALRGKLLPLRHEVGPDKNEMGEDDPTFPRYVWHRFKYTDLRSPRGITFTFFSGSAKFFYVDKPLVIINETVQGAIAVGGYLTDREWRYTGRLSDINRDGTLQTDSMVSGVSAALAYMELGSRLDRALSSKANDIPTFRGTIDFQYWYSCQSCVPGGRGIVGQSLASARFAQIGGQTYVITNAPRVRVAEIAKSGAVRRYFGCRKPLA